MASKLTRPLSYDEFRTGYTFGDVYHMIFNRKWKRRAGVLGYWRQIKQAMYAEYVRDFRAARRRKCKTTADDDSVPF